MRFSLDVGPGVLNRNGEARRTHGWKIDDVVADKSGFWRGDSRFLDDVSKACSFIVTTLQHELEFQIAGTQCHGFRVAFGDESGAQTADTSQGNGNAIVGVESFELN